jgi:hypothetical protein
MPDMVRRALPSADARLCSGVPLMRFLAPTINSSCGFAPMNIGTYRIRSLLVVLPGAVR